MDSTNYTEDFKNSIQLHGHACIGLAVGYVAAMTAMERLGLQRAQDEELIAIAECDACGVDAIQAVLGCTLGKGNLIYRDHGKNVFTVIDRRKNDAMRIALNVDLFARTDDSRLLWKKSSAVRQTRPNANHSGALKREKSTHFWRPHPNSLSPLPGSNRRRRAMPVFSPPCSVKSVESRSWNRACACGRERRSVSPALKITDVGGENHCCDQTEVYQKLRKNYGAASLRLQSYS